MEQRISEGLEKSIHVYPTNPALKRFDKVEIVQTKFFQDIQDESEHLKPIEDIKETFKKLTQQQNHEID